MSDTPHTTMVSVVRSGCGRWLRSAVIFIAIAASLLVASAAEPLPVAVAGSQDLGDAETETLADRADSGP